MKTATVSDQAERQLVVSKVSCEKVTIVLVHIPAGGGARSWPLGPFQVYVGTKVSSKDINTRKYSKFFRREALVSPTPMTKAPITWQVLSPLLSHQSTRLSKRPRGIGKRSGTSAPSRSSPKDFDHLTLSCDLEPILPGSKVFDLLLPTKGERFCPGLLQRAISNSIP